MEEIINVCVNNGLGVASFIALLAFIFKYQSKITDTLEKISRSQEDLNKSQQQMQTTLTMLTARIDKLEDKIDT